VTHAFRDGKIVDTGPLITPGKAACAARLMERWAVARR